MNMKTPVYFTYCWLLLGEFVVLYWILNYLNLGYGNHFSEWGWSQSLPAISFVVLDAFFILVTTVEFVKYVRKTRTMSFEEEMTLRHELNKCNYCNQSFTFRQDMYIHEMYECPLRPKFVENQCDH